MVSEKSRAIKKPNKDKTVIVRHTKQIDIPKAKFLETLDELKNDVEWCNDFFDRRCSVPIHQISATSHRHSYKSLSFMLLEEARLCLLQRDWKSLAKILVAAKPNSRKEHSLFFQVFVRYAAICLAHNPDNNLMSVFVQGVAACANDKDKQEFFKCLVNG